ncbi:MAG: arylsulfotransferase family protein [Bacteroidota bacterium]|nr:arylsulfotransferase family protein [Bacteroidota bacterium]
MQAIEPKKTGFKIAAVFLILTLGLFSQRIPKDSSILNYTQILFEYPSVKKASEYKLQLIDLSIPKEIKEYTSSSNLKIISEFSFGKYYKWRVLATDKNKKTIDSSSYFVFKIRGVELVNKNRYRIKINYTDKSINTNELVFIDYNRIAINKKGEPVWYLPDIPGKVNFTERIRDLRITHDGTFTFLNNRSAIECDINGNILWEAPPIANYSKDSMGFYHHCFEKLTYGNYMVLGTKYVFKKIPKEKLTEYKGNQNTKIINGEMYIRVEYGIVMEYDIDKKLVWSWDSESYLKDEDIFAHGNADTIANPGPHMNSFDMNEKEGGTVSVGFRDLSRIVLIDRQTGIVLNSFGEKLPSGEAHQANGMFKFQHDSRFLNDGRIAVFNNNDILLNKDASSSVVVFNPSQIKPVLDSEWSFNCDFDTLANGRSFKGGSVSELKNGNLLVSMGNLNRIFEVTPTKKIVWDGFCEQYSPSAKKWNPYPQYRISYASSLYPNYFSVKIENEAKKKKNSKLHTFSLNVSNEGSEKDSYHILIKDEFGYFIQEITTEILESATGSLHPVSIPVTPSRKKIIIEVTSITNKNNTKKLSYE